MLGAAIATTISQILLRVLFIIESYNLFNLNPFNLKNINIILSFVITTGIFYFITKVIYPKNIYYLIPYAVSFVLLYITLLFLTRSFEKEDWMILEAIKEKIKTKV